MPAPTTNSDDALFAALSRGGPMNIERAIAVMERHELDGLVLGEPVNVFHALGHWPQIARTRTGQPPTTFALLARARPDAPGLVTSRFLYFYTWADGHDRSDVQAWLYGEPGDSGDVAPLAEGELCPDRHAAPSSALEVERRAALAAVPENQRLSRDAGGALVRAMRDLGLWQGRIGFDDPVIAEVCARHDHPGAMVDAANILREIRVIKSPIEIALMRRAAEANAAALDAVGKAVRAGAVHHELQALFRAEAALRGNTAVFLNVDRVSSDLSRAQVSDGQTLFLDGVSHFMNYHGDFARTVFVGDPPASARRAAEAAAFGWSSVREVLRPGLRYSQIVAHGQAAVKQAGFDAIVGFGPHSVGLAHTDEPGEPAGGFWRKPDLVLEAGMVISVDCPVLDSGIGGSAHCEDLVLIAPTGSELLHSSYPAVTVV